MVNREMLKESMEARWRKRQCNQHIIIYIISFVIWTFFVLGYSIRFDDIEYLLIILGGLFFLGIIYVPTIIYYEYCYRKILSSTEGYKIYEVVLDSPHHSYLYKGSTYYTVKFKTDKNTVMKDTKPLFTGWFLGLFPLEDYNNKKINIAYNENEDKMILIGNPKDSGDGWYDL